MTTTDHQSREPLPGGPVVVHRVDRAVYPPYGGWVVCNPSGTGMLREAYAVREVDELWYGPRTRMHYEHFLLFGDRPLIRWHGTGCPTCEQILQPIARSRIERQNWARDINRLSSESIAADKPDWVASLHPFFQLLGDGFWLVAANDYYPTDGSGSSFWTEIKQAEPCGAMSDRPFLPQVPVFLLSTQPTSCFSADRFQRARESFQDCPGIALHLGGYASALLDGHHRALAAAETGSSFRCVTFRWVSCHVSATNKLMLQVDMDIKERLRQVPETVLSWTSAFGRHAGTASPFPTQLSDENVDQILNANSARQTAAAIPVRLPTIATYPTHESMDSVVRVCGRGRHVAERAIESIFSADPDAEGIDEKACDLINALDTLNDSRLIPVGLRLGRDTARRRIWPMLYRTLTRHRSPEVDDLFVGFLVNDDGTYPDIKQTIDDYFRQPAQSGATQSGEQLP